jgi:glycosyltransferase involved in cell wall biosynthesis
MRVHQILVGASPGDAVTNIALAVDDLLPSTVESNIWGLYVDPRMRPRVEKVTRMPDPAEAGPDDVLIYHLSIGDERLADMAARRPERLVVHYHNITPAHFYEELDPVFARRLATGRDQMVALVGRAELVICDSTFNADEVRPHTEAVVRVVAPPLDFHRLEHVDAHEPTQHHFDVTGDLPMIVHVGQLLPHKRPELLVAAMHVLTVELGVAASLVMVGPHRNADYAWAIQRYVEELGLTNVSLAGERTDAELVAHLNAATIFATATAHEGFCVPVVEAFAFGLPVVATGVGAIPETVGDGGLVLPADSGPEMLAEAFAALLGDEGLRRCLAIRGQRQLEQFSLERTSMALEDALAEVLV